MLRSKLKLSLLFNSSCSCQFFSCLKVKLQVLPSSQLLTLTIITIYQWGFGICFHLNTFCQLLSFGYMVQLEVFGRENQVNLSHSFKYKPVQQTQHFYPQDSQPCGPLPNLEFQSLATSRRTGMLSNLHLLIMSPVFSLYFIGI